MIGQAPLVQNPIIYYGTMSTLLGSAGSIFPPAVTTRDLTGHLPTTMNFSFSVQHNVGRGHSGRCGIRRLAGTSPYGASAI